jgi:biotin synthase-like enzyme
MGMTDMIYKNIRKFKVKFKDDKIIIQALTKEQAKILAQAGRIKQGWDYDVVDIEEIINATK